MKIPAVAVAVLAALSVSILASCWNPASNDSIPDMYYDPVDSAWKVLANMETAYNTRNIQTYLACFRDDFQFHLLEVDWDDYDGDGVIDSLWGLDLEEEFHQLMFGSVTAIELTLTGTQESPWSGDSTGQALSLPRTFDLKVYTDLAHTTGLHAFGGALFICRPDSTGEWYVWQWADLSDLGTWWRGLRDPATVRITSLDGSPLEDVSWAYIKHIFSTSQR